jgi:hypothetical protein
MRMYDPSGVPEMPVQQNVCGGIGGGFQMAPDLPAFPVEYHHVLRGHLPVGDPGRLDHNISRFGIPLTGISPGKDHQSVFYKGQVRFQYLFPDLLEHYNPFER